MHELRKIHAIHAHRFPSNYFLELKILHLLFLWVLSIFGCISVVPRVFFLFLQHFWIIIEQWLVFLLKNQIKHAKELNWLIRSLIVLCLCCSFASVKDGTHVLLREYNFIKATLHNRSSFVRLFWRSFANIARKTGRSRFFALFDVLHVLILV